MNEKVIVSFIIPLYNTQVESIVRCVTSINDQIRDNIEILIVDDGSKQDLSLEYDKRVASLNNVQLLHVENAGAANARNVGIKRARGEYIIFVDSDDYIPSSANLRKLIEKVKAENLDLLIGAYKEHSKAIDKTFTAEEIQLSIIKQNFEYDFVEPGSPWSKVFKKDFLKNNRILFNRSLRRSHDRVFMLEVFEHNPKFRIVGDLCYCFCIEEGNSLTRAYNPKTVAYLGAFFDAVVEFVRINHNNHLFGHALKCLATILNRQCAQQIYFHPLNKDSFFKRYRSFKANSPKQATIVNYRGKALMVYSFLLKYRMLLILSLILEINKYRYYGKLSH